MLFAKDTPKENIVVRGARVIDPVEGIDAVLDVRVDDGVIAALGQNLDTNSHRVIDAEGLVLAPAFVDPHVHLRTPGREDEENDRLRHGRGSRGRLLRDPRDAEHRSGRRLGGNSRLARSKRRAPRRRFRSASSPRSRRDSPAPS